MSPKLTSLLSNSANAVGHLSAVATRWWSTFDCLPQTPIIAEPERSAKAPTLHFAVVVSRLDCLRRRQLAIHPKPISQPISEK